MSPTLEGLTADHPADIAWRGSGGEAFFLWVSAPDAKGTRLFTLDRAYFLRQGGKTFWAFLDASAKGKHGGSFDEFLWQKHVQTTVAYPASDHSDSPMTTVQAVSCAADGRSVVRLTYVSTMGFGRNWIDLPSWLVYFDGRGKPVLASIDIEGDYCWSMGWTRNVNATSCEVVWHQPSDPLPFHVRVKKSVRTCEMGEDASALSYTVYNDSLWTGFLPLGSHQQADPPYALADGKSSLNMLANALAYYNSSSSDEFVQRLWLEILSNANPAIPADQIIEEGTHIALPDIRAAAGPINQLARASSAVGDVR